MRWDHFSGNRRKETKPERKPEQVEKLILTEEDWDALCADLKSPPQANEKLKKLLKD